MESRALEEALGRESSVWFNSQSGIGFLSLLYSGYHIGGNFAENLCKGAVLVLVHQKRAILNFLLFSRAGPSRSRYIFPIDRGACWVCWSLACLDENEKLRVDRNTAKEPNAKVVGHDLSSTTHENVCALAAVGANKTAHILHNTENSNAGFLAEVELLPNIGSCHSLRGGDHDGTSKLTRSCLLQQVLRQRNMFVAGARRRVDKEIVGLVPEHVGQKLANHGGLLWPTPDDGITPLGKEEAETHDAKGSNAG